MSAVPDHGRPALRPMQLDDVGDVLALEESVYPYPWSRTNFTDSIDAGYDACVLCAADGSLLGYFLLMCAVDEAHLLNVAVAAPHQGRGLGRHLLDRIVERARARRMESVLLEVRPSNERALIVYRAYGFVQIGRRKGYYPADGGREDAIVMRIAV